MLAQYFKWKKGKDADWNMKKLMDIYNDIRTVNINISRKIANLELKDTCINSVVILNNFADYVSLNLDDDSLQELEALFNDYMK